MISLGAIPSGRKTGIPPAARIPSAIMSQRTIPPKIFTRIMDSFIHRACSMQVPIP